jgi:hypothetical protein
MNLILVKHPSAVIPILMSLAAIGVVLIHIAMFGTARQPDEGSAAHIWQLLMAGQVPIVAYFALRWIPQVPRQGWYVLAIQILAMLAACAPVYYFKW